jgi:hypothetical protein
MKNTANKNIMFCSLFFVICFFANAQIFNDLPFPNPDFMTYFQQETSSLMKFQAANNINVPFFVSVSWRQAWWSGTYPLGNVSNFFDGEMDLRRADAIIDILTGFQIKVADWLYIPVLAGIGSGMTSGDADEMWWKNELLPNGLHDVSPTVIGNESRFGLFAGSGVFINTKIIKGSIYAGWGRSGYDMELYYGDEGGTPSQEIHEPQQGFKIALIPVVPTSEWAYIGKALNNIFGYIGIGNNVVYSPEQEKPDSQTAAFMNAINTALDFAFNRIHFDAMTLDSRVFFTRNNYDAAAKNETYGLEIQGMFTQFPFGFSLEGGWMNFSSVSKYFISEYPDTSGYFKGTVFFPFKKVTFGVMYEYDTVMQSRISLALSTNFLATLLSYNGVNKTKEAYGQPLTMEGHNFTLAGRYRHGGWKAGKK